MRRTLICAGIAHAVPTRSLLSQRSSPLDLHGADLRGHDLRSLDLHGADLRDADLRQARTGLSVGWRAWLAALSVLGSVSVGLLAGLAGSRISALIASSSKLEHWLGLVVAAELLLFLSAALWKGLRVAVNCVLLPACVGAVLISVLGALYGGTGAAGGAILAFSTLMFAIVALSTLVRAVAHTTGLLLLVVIALSGWLASNALHGGLSSTVLALAAFLLTRRTLRDDPELPLLSRWSRRIASSAGTDLRDADLRGARLEGCRLVCTDLRGAKLEGARMNGACEVMCSLDAAQRSLLPLEDSAQVRQRL